MFLADCHNHTRCSADSDADLSAVLTQAARVGLSLVCTTDHLDLVLHEGKVVENWDWTPLLQQHEAAKAACPAGLELLMGIELGGLQLLTPLGRQLLGRVELDMVVGSAHNLTLDRGGLDFIELDYRDETVCREALDNYFDSLIALSAMDEIDTLAHLPYVLRYMNDRDGNRVDLTAWYDRIRIILDNLIRHGTALEVNTNRGRWSVRVWRPILALYRDMGGRLLTLGTDSHRPEDIGKGLADAAQLLRELGFTHYHIYRRHKPEAILL